MKDVATYLSEDKSYYMVQRRGGTDDLEHKFAKIRQKF